MRGGISDHAIHRATLEISLILHQLRDIDEFVDRVSHIDTHSTFYQVAGGAVDALQSLIAKLRRVRGELPLPRDSTTTALSVSTYLPQCGEAPEAHTTADPLAQSPKRKRVMSPKRECTSLLNTQAR